MDKPLTDMTAEEIDGLPPLEQSRLTDAETDVLIEVWGGAILNTRVELPREQLVAILAELREQLQDVEKSLRDLEDTREQNAAMRKEWIDSLSTVYKALHREQEQNAKLVAALDEMLEYPGDEYVLDRAVTLLASVRGAE